MNFLNGEMRTYCKQLQKNMNILKLIILNTSPPSVIFTNGEIFYVCGVWC